MTKEQQKALETANRRKFFNNIAIVAMTDILDQAENIRKTLDVKMRYLIKKEEISSNGITIQPLGISMPTKKHEIKLPQAEGKYKVLIDVISPDRRINSFVKEIEVKK